MSKNNILLDKPECDRKYLIKSMVKMTGFEPATPAFPRSIPGVTSTQVEQRLRKCA
jgi:hypothetical protein